MPYGQDAHRLPSLDDLIDDPVRADSQRPETQEPPAKPMPRLWLPVQKDERLLDCVREAPLQIQDLPAGPAREDDPRQLSFCPALADLATELVERHGVAVLNLSEPFVDGSERLG